MSLQFSECHTKIRHVDAHATLGDGVVVQVMGELSNRGQPMRRFMQTFVLAPEEIHKKVMSLQFSECHTKIRHVDAHATLGDGVVVQVMGELSNRGQPMRRFMQTFVLAPEVHTPKVFKAMCLTVKLIGGIMSPVQLIVHKPSFTRTMMVEL
ncbi:ras GTPase-activating protein-binding protein 2 [Tachysurus ichikawai]